MASPFWPLRWTLYYGMAAAILFSAAFGQSLIDAISEKLKAQNKPYAVSLSQKPASIQGGMILAEGNIETNLSYEILIKNMRDELEAEVARVLTE